jgi:DNA-directed RNA polymerase beta' subunit
MEDWENRKMTNPYAGVRNPYENLENVYEDAQVNLKQAEFEKEQSQQAMANIMQSMQSAAGSSGVAGLAQVLANQGVKQAQQASMSIAAQEQTNQQRAIAESGRLAEQKALGEQKRDLMFREGERMVEQFDIDKETKMLEFSLQRKAAADQSIADAQATVDSFVTGAVTAGINAAI